MNHHQTVAHLHDVAHGIPENEAFLSHQVTEDDGGASRVAHEAVDEDAAIAIVARQLDEAEAVLEVVKQIFFRRVLGVDKMTRESFPLVLARSAE